MRLPELRIGKLKPDIPIVQGGMAVRISTASLAAAVANEGGVGIIAGSGMTPQELKEEIREARTLTKGILGVNIMFAITAFAELFKTALQEKIDLVVSGAGFSRDMFSWGKEADIPVVPIVSTVKLAQISERLGAPAVVVEGKEAGGHLGTNFSVHKLVSEVKKVIGIPIIAAGGIVEGADLVKAFKQGADGVQIGTRFAASKESNADEKLKEFYLQARQEDVILIDSPVGLPGRAIKNIFADKIAAGKAPAPESCSGCLKNCQGNFCIMKALNNAQKGNLEEGLVFAGEYVGKIKQILSVKEIIRSLLQEVEYAV